MQIRNFFIQLHVEIKIQQFIYFVNYMQQMLQVHKTFYNTFHIYRNIYLGININIFHTFSVFYMRSVYFYIFKFFTNA